MADNSLKSDDSVPEKSAAAAKPKIAVATLTDFLESVPPSAWREIRELLWVNSGSNFVLIQPDIRLHCSDPNCNGVRTYRAEGTHYFPHNEPLECFLNYTCSNCQKSIKRFSVLVVRQPDLGPGSGKIYKYGEHPVFGPITPPRLLELLGDKDRDLFFRGRRCESQGLGIGAFVCYRRVVDNHRKQIFEEIIKVAKTMALKGKSSRLWSEPKTSRNSKEPWIQ